MIDTLLQCLSVELLLNGSREMGIAKVSAYMLICYINQTTRKVWRLRNKES
jgi:hypothetical protein